MYALNAVLSILLISLLGYALRKAGRVEDGFVKKLNSFCFNYILPLQLFNSVYTIDSFGSVSGGAVIFIALYVVVAFVIGMLVAVAISPDNSRRGAIAQGFFRSNTAIMGLALADLLGGAKAVATLSVMMSITIIFYNSLAVVALTVFAPEGQHKTLNIKELVMGVFHSPMIRGVVAGLLCLAIRSIIPRNEAGQLLFSLKDTLSPLYISINSLAKAASPLMLMIIGMQFEFKVISQQKKEVLVTVLGRTVFIPALSFIALYVCSSVLHLFEAGPDVYQACIGVTAAPCGIVAAVMTAEMGGDGEFAGQTVIWSTIVSVFTIFGFIIALRYLGLL